MITENPFSVLSEIISPGVMQLYVVAMFVLVVGGTVLDTLHKKSAQWFYKNTEEAKKSATREVTGGEKVSAALGVVTQEILTSAEFQNMRRRTSHLFTMWGFIIFVATSAIMVFFYASSDASTPVIWPLLWHLGALSLCFGGYWFWFAIRVDVAAEGNPWYRIVRADIFILSLLATATFGLIWSFFQAATGVLSGMSLLFLGLFLLSSTVLFAGVLWSKFAHMFFKPAAAFQKRITKLDGSAENLPTISRDDPEQQKRHSMELLQDAPMNMGLGIKRERPNHY
jgi:hypothetical protein